MIFFLDDLLSSTAEKKLMRKFRNFSDLVFVIKLLATR
jgi:hypothetical protein